MSKRVAGIGWMMMVLACCMTACKDDTTSAGSAILSPEDAIVVMVDTFPLTSMVENSGSIVAQSDSCLLGELETDYGVLRASILAQLACPEGYSYPANATIDSICLYVYYSSWVGDGYSPLALNVYMMDKKTFDYYGTYPSDLKVEDLFVAEKVCHYDFDISAFENVRPGQYEEYPDEFIPLDAELVQLVTERIPGIRKIAVASADKFVEDKAEKLRLRNMGCGICEMELAAIARTCERSGVKCLSIKCISDTFDGNGEDFNTNVRRSAEKAFRVIREVLKLL